MKKLLLLVAVCLTFVGCKWYHETFDSPEECAEWYAEEMNDAVEDDDVDEFIEVYNDCDAWQKGLGAADQKKANEAYDKWLEDNASKDKWGDFMEKHADKLKDVL